MPSRYACPTTGLHYKRRIGGKTCRTPGCMAVLPKPDLTDRQVEVLELFGWRIPTGRGGRTQCPQCNPNYEIS